MRWLSLVLFCLLFVGGYSQTLDSVQYQYGYLYFHKYGKGEPVIILSGGPGNSYIQAEELALRVGEKYKAILPEQRGTGRSIPKPLDTSSISLRAAVEDLHLLMRTINATQSVFIGHSWGATLAMAFAAQYPKKVKSLILISPGNYKSWENMFDILQVNIRSRLSSDEIRRVDTLTDKIADGKATDIERNEYRKILRSTYIFDRLKFDSLLVKMDVPSNASMRLIMNEDLKQKLDLTSSLPKYKGPLAIISGRQDVLAFNAYEIKILMPSAELNWVDQCGHFPFLEQPQVFYPVLFKMLGVDQ